MGWGGSVETRKRRGGGGEEIEKGMGWGRERWKGKGGREGRDGR